MKKLFASYWFRSAFYTFLQRFSVTAFGLLNFVILIRSLSKQEMGIWALFLVVTTIFEGTKSALLKNAHVKFVSGSNESSEKAIIASSSLLINGFLTLIFIVFILFFSGWLSHTLNSGIDLSLMLKWFIPGIISMVFFSHFEAIQQSHFDFKGVFAGHFTRQTTFFFLLLTQHFLLGINLSLTNLAIYQSISICLGTIIIYLYSKKYLLMVFKPTKTWIKKIFKYGGFIFGSGMLSNIFSNLDQILTAKFIAPASVAYYNAATRINGFIDIPTYAAGEILFPKISKASVEDGTDKVKYLYEKMVSVLLAFITPLAIFVILFPEFIIQIIAGSQYVAAAPILRLYMLASLFGPMQNQAANVLNSINKPGLCFTINTISLCLKLLIGFMCLYYIGFYGAAIGTLITAILSGILWYFIIQKQIGSKFKNILSYMFVVYKNVFVNSKKAVGTAKKKFIST